MNYPPTFRWVGFTLRLIKRLRNKKIMHKIIAKIFNITIQDSINIATRYYQHINHLV